MNTTLEATPPPVPARATQGGDVRSRWGWAEPAVWTERMLTALETGVKGNQWFSLIDKVYAQRTLGLAWEKVRSNAGGSGVDGMTIGRFAKDCPRGLLALNEQLRQATYQPSPVKRCWIPKPGSSEKRPLPGYFTRETRLSGGGWFSQRANAAVACLRRREAARRS